MHSGGDPTKSVRSWICTVRCLLHQGWISGTCTCTHVSTHKAVLWLWAKCTTIGLYPLLVWLVTLLHVRVGFLGKFLLFYMCCFGWCWMPFLWFRTWSLVVFTFTCVLLCTCWVVLMDMSLIVHVHVWSTNVSCVTLMVNSCVALLMVVSITFFASLLYHVLYSVLYSVYHWGRQTDCCWNVLITQLCGYSVRSTLDMLLPTHSGACV